MDPVSSQPNYRELENKKTEKHSMTVEKPLPINIDIAPMMKSFFFRGEFEELVKILQERIQHNPNSILFIDEIHTIIGAGASEN